MHDETRPSHWEQHALNWRHVGLPLRPTGQDVRIMESLLAAHLDQAARVLLLGVTPELARLRWPDRTHLLAVDRSAGMIQRVWPGDALALDAQVIRGDWNALPLSDGCRDTVIGDGFYTPLAYPSDYRRLGRELARVLRPGGLYLIRAFVRPDAAESLEAIEADLLAGRIGTVHALKWRLAMLLHDDLATGVRLDAVWRLWDDLRAQPAVADRLRQWPAEEVATLEAYRGAPGRYTFPTLTELRAALAPDFTELDCRLPDYELGDRCPILLLETR